MVLDARGGDDLVVITVLVVDDHDAFRTEATQMLVAAGLRVVGEAADAMTALEVARETRPGVVLLDVGLPDASGLWVAERIRAEGIPSQVVLVSTRDAAAYGEPIRPPIAGFIRKDELSAAAVVSLLGAADDDQPSR